MVDMFEGQYGSQCSWSRVSDYGGVDEELGKEINDITEL